MDKFSLNEKFGLIQNYWDPKIAAQFNGQHMRLAKLKGEFVWHSHAEEDEVFVVIDGNLRIEFRDKTVELGPGEVLVIPRGIEHKPVADEEVKVMLLEPATTVNTGENDSELTRKNLEAI